MNKLFAVLPAPPGYQLIEIDDNAGDGNIDRWLSEPRIVLGFVVEQNETYFSVSPVTSFGVHDSHPNYALIRPDGKIEIPSGGLYGECTLESLDHLKEHVLRFSAELDREMADSMQKDGDRKQAAQCRRHATKLDNEADVIMGLD